jgi:hypothetical protein
LSFENPLVRGLVQSLQHLKYVCVGAKNRRGQLPAAVPSIPPEFSSVGGRGFVGLVVRATVPLTAIGYSGDDWVVADRQ